MSSTLKVDIVQANTDASLTLNDDVSIAEDLTVAGDGSLTGTLTIGNEIQVPDGSASDPSYTFTNDPDTGLRVVTPNNLILVSGGTDRLDIASNGEIRIASTGSLSWGSSGINTPDIFLTRDAANVLAQRNSTSAQAFRVYNTYTDASNYERGNIEWNSNTFRIGPSNAGTGSMRNLLFGGIGADTGIFFRPNVSTADGWNINSSSHLLAETDNTNDIGASGASRPRNLYVGTDITLGGVLNGGVSTQTEDTAPDASTDYVLTYDASATANKKVLLSRVKSTLATPIATTSGTEQGFTSIPSWVTKIFFMLDGVSTNGTSNIIIQLGDSGGYETSGYSGAHWNHTGASVANLSDGFLVDGFAAAAAVTHGMLTLVLMNSSTNTWAATGLFGFSSGTAARQISGTKSLSATLDRIRITTSGGVNTFDAGSINIRYE